MQDCEQPRKLLHFMHLLFNRFVQTRIRMLCEQTFFYLEVGPRCYNRSYSNWPCIELKKPICYDPLVCCCVSDVKLSCISLLCWKLSLKLCVSQKFWAHCDIVTETAQSVKGSLQAECLGLHSKQGQSFLFLSLYLDWLCGSSSLSIQWELESLSLGIKSPECEAGHSLPFKLRLNLWILTSVPPYA